VAEVKVAVLAELGEQADGDASPWLTVREAADWLHWPRARVYKLTAAGAIPHRRHGGRILFRRDELCGWLDGFREGRAR